MRTRIPGTVGVLALLTTLAAWASVSPPPEAPRLDGTSWVLAELPGRAPDDKTSATLQFKQGRVSGSDGCNRFSGAYAVNGSTLELSQLASTQMACPPEVMRQAQAFMAALLGAKSYRIAGQRLELLAADGKTSAIFGAQSMMLRGTSWNATGINNGRQAVVSLVNESRVTMSFGADGSASGTAGCNNYSVPYQADGTSLAFGQAAVTRKMCAQPEGVMEQEQQFLKALSTVSVVRFEADRLELRTADGALAVTLRRAEGG